MLDGKPILSPDLPIGERMVLACLYRVQVDAQRRRDRPAQIAAQRALSSAVAAAEGAVVP